MDMFVRRHARRILLVLLGVALTITFQYVSRSVLKNVMIANNAPITTTARTTAEILLWNSTSWAEWKNFCGGPNQFDSASLQTPAGNLRIFIHDIKADKWVSGEIKKHGAWEPDLMKLIYHYMAEDKDLNLLDIGSHIGQFSLMAARMGRMAIAVDPLLENVLRLCNSIELNNYKSLVKVFYVALSDSRKKVSFVRNTGNIGGTRIKSVNKTTGTSFNPNIIDTVFLDDILPFIPFNRAFIKMDVEAHENNVLKGSNNLFATLDIPFVLMEWMQHINNPTSANEIINFMNLRNYKAYLVNTTNKPLEFKDYKKWPVNVLWKN